MTVPMSEPVWWNAKFKELRLVRVPSAMYPRHDGDTAALEDAAEMVFTYTPTECRLLDADGDLWALTVWNTGINPDVLLAPNFWPGDGAFARLWP